MNDADEFRKLVTRLQAGDAKAIDLAYRRFGPYLRAAVRKKLHPGLRPRFDSLDFVQDVWASLLVEPFAGRFDSPEAFIAYLGRVAQNKVTDGVRRRFGSQRDAAKSEVPIVGENPRGGQRPLAHNPTPSQFAIAGEEFQRILSQFPPGHRVIVERLREGYTNDDIAQMANVSKSTVDRVVRRLKELVGI